MYYLLVWLKDCWNIYFKFIVVGEIFLNLKELVLECFCYIDEKVSVMFLVLFRCV